MNEEVSHGAHGGTEEMEINEVSARIVDAALRIHRELGPGLLESVYEVVLADLLRLEGFEIERQKPIPIQAFGKSFEEGFRADLIVNGLVLIELKSIEQLSRAHRKQVQTYLRLCGLRVGLLINFGGELLKGNIERIVVGEVPDLRNGPINPK
jgi:GxxExxY protein